MYGYKQFILETKQQQLCNEKQIVRHTQKKIQNLKERCIEIGQSNIEQIILYHVYDGRNRYLEKVNRLLQNTLKNIKAYA